MSIETDPSITGRPFFCSWSGGKDSCLAFYHAIRNGGIPKSLFTMLSEDGETSRSHGLPKSLIEQQAGCLNLPAAFRSASWEQYEPEFIAALREFRNAGIEAGIFGDIDVVAHREWVVRVCNLAGIIPVHPLWGRERRELLQEFIDIGFRARIIVVNEEKLGRHFLGKTIQTKTISEMEAAGIDPSGELGEYHSVVTDGPLFSSKIDLKAEGELCHNGYCFLKVTVG